MTTAPELYNWHPLVHARFGETLFFYLLRLREPSLRPVAEQLRAGLVRAGIRHACEYTVFGHWDALVRVWLTPASRHRLLHVLRPGGESNVADMREFQTSEIRLLWSGDDRDRMAPDPAVQDSIAEHRRYILEVASQGAGPPDSDRQQGLVEAQLLLPRPAVPRTAVKFYVTLSRLGGDLSPAGEAERVASAVAAAQLSDRASVYVGFGGFADYLIRCVADTYADVLQYTASLDTGFRKLRVRPMTLLIANNDAIESDNINDLWALDTDDENTLRVLELGGNGAAHLEALPRDQRDALNNLVNVAHELSAGDRRLRDKLRSLLRASLQNDRDALISAVAFLLEFEWLLGEYLKRAWADVFGPEWIKRLAEEFTRYDSQHEAEVLKKPDEWTLGSCVQMAITAADVNKEVSAQLTQHLGDRWKDQMRALVPVRNLIAHGRLRTIDRFDDFTGEWGEKLLSLLNIATLHFRCELLMTKELTK